MKQDTKETIGPRGTVAGFRPLIGKERWHREDFTVKDLNGNMRPLLLGELALIGDKCLVGSFWKPIHESLLFCEAKDFGGSRCFCTKCPLPPPQVETFEAHGHVWYRHVPGEACPVEPDVVVDCLYRHEEKNMYYSGPVKASNWDWLESDGFYDIIGYRFPDFPAVHTPLQQEQSSVQHVEKTMQSFQHDTTKQRLATMYHGWCDVAPDSVAECIADVARVLYPTDAERCEAAFQKWWSGSGFIGSDKVALRGAWQTAWSAAKQEKL